MSEPLKPCPVCGEAVVMDSLYSVLGHSLLYYVFHPDPEFGVDCVFGSGSITRPYYAADALTAAWNTRREAK